MMSPNLTIQEVIHFFIENGIPPGWVDHSYTYGLNAINHMATSPMSAPSIAECDNERHARIQAYGVPPSIPEWDGWRHPTEEDMGIIRAQHAQRSQKSRPGYDPRLEDGWTRVGESGLFTHLSSRKEYEVQRFRDTHPVDLPSFPALDTPAPQTNQDAPTSRNVPEDALTSSAGAGPMVVEETTEGGRPEEGIIIEDRQS